MGHSSAASLPALSKRTNPDPKELSFRFGLRDRLGSWGYAGARFFISRARLGFRGGRTSVNAVENPDRQDKVRLGGTVSLPLTVRQSLKLGYNTDATTLRGSDYDTFTLTWQAVRLGGESRP